LALEYPSFAKFFKWNVTRETQAKSCSIPLAGNSVGDLDPAAGSSSLASPEIPLEVNDHDITNLEIPITRIIPVTVHVTMDDGSPLPVFPNNQVIGMHQMNQKSEADGLWTAIGQSGIRETVMRPGNSYLLLGPPQGFFVTSMTAGTTDMLKEPLHVDPGTKHIQVEAKLSTARLTSPPAVSIRGRVTGNHPGLPLQLVNTASSRNGAVQTTYVNRNGNFEFSGVSPGEYHLTIAPIPAFLPNILAFGKDVENLEISIPEGNVLVGMLMGTASASPGIPEHLAIQFDNGKEIKHVDLLPKPSYSFIYALDEGSYRVSITGLPAGYSVKSISGDGRNLMDLPLVIVASNRIPTIQFLLDYKGN